MSASAGIVAPVVAAALQGTPAVPDFDRDVRPLLADRCFACHGPDEDARQAELRLDRREGLFAERDGEAVVTPGEPDHSLLAAKVMAGEMPPRESGLALSPDERELLLRWIEGGAPYAEHWFFQPLSAATPPEVEDTRWPLDDIDRFTLARLQREGLAPAPEAAPDRWLRRVSFDLTGLAPSADETAAFVADATPGAVERVVDHLLGSPRHAERMTSQWLDLARYADSYGYQSDVQREVWPWRDWVLRAYAQNMPYDRFLTWQLAGDLLPDATQEQRLATTFNRLHRQTNEGGSVEEEMRVEYVADRVNTFGTAFLGLTLECARCHDHKFDPLRQSEYYGLAAFFANIDESGLYSHFTNAVPTPTLELPGEEQREQRAELRGALEAAERAHTSRALDVVRAFDHEAALPGCVGSYAMDEVEGKELLNGAADTAPGRVHGANTRCVGSAAAAEPGGALELSGDDAVTFPVVGHFRRWNAFSLGLRVRVPATTERTVVVHRSKAWHDAGSRGYQLLLEHGRPSFSLIHFWPGNALRVRAHEPIPEREWVHLGVTYDGSSRAAGARLFVDGVEVDVEVVRDGLTRSIVGGSEGDLTIGERFRDRGFRGGRVDDLTVFERALAPLEMARLADEREWTAFFERRAHWSGRDRLAFAAVVAARAPPGAELAEVRRAWAELTDAIPEIMVMDELPAPRGTHVLRRGRYDQPGERVEPHTPRALPDWPTGEPRNRLGLARWLTGPSRAATARVAANRLWQIAFGRGLVPTAEDFGTQGARPSHPDLLDYLAAELIASGWDQRALLRRIVLSATYRQSSRAPQAVQQRDPDGALLARYPPHRLSAEAVRDHALLASGLLVEELGGPSVKPYQPPGLWREVASVTYTPDTGAARHRRSLYTFWKRTSPPPSMLLFDAAKRDVCIARRQRTTTPLQALVLWNDLERVGASRHLASRALRERETPEGRATYVFRALVGRAPAPEELRVLTELARTEREHFADRPEDASALLAAGAPADHESSDPSPLPPESLAAWTVVANTLMGHDAVVMQR